MFEEMLDLPEIGGIERSQGLNGYSPTEMISVWSYE